MNGNKSVTANFTTEVLSTGTVTDVDGNVYTTVKIGNQTWTVENLRVTKFNDGTEIPPITDGTAWNAITTPGYCWYKNNMTDNKTVYGALYNWYAVNTGKLAPAGWHVPTDAEWTTPGTALGGNALSGGSRFDDGYFYFIGTNGYWWSATENDESSAYFRLYGSGALSRTNGLKSFGLSVRLVKD